MTTTLAILTAIIILLMFGAGQKILDNLRLNDKQAIIILIAIAIGIAVPPIYVGEYFAVSIGGYIIPFGENTTKSKYLGGRNYRCIQLKKSAVEEVMRYD